jgi:transglutaminase-like putative cysteine protease
VVVETRSADCDDLSVLVGTLVGLVGAQVRLVAGAFGHSPTAPDGNKVLSHVWLEAFDPTSGAWVVLDPVPGRRVDQMLGRLVRTVAMEVLK